MREFPTITIDEPNFSLWLWLGIPLLLAVAFFFFEFLVEKVTEKYRGKPVVGIGYVLMGIALLCGAMGVTAVQNTIEADRTLSAVVALEDVGFKEIRISLESGTFGAYYEGELVRAALVPVQNHPGEYRVIETPPPA